MATTVLALWQAKDEIVETAAIIVKHFFSPKHVESQTEPVKFECKLAPSFPDKSGLDNVSKNTKVMVAVSNKRLQISLPKMTKFQDVQGEFNANLQLVLLPKLDGMEQISKIFHAEDKSFFDFSHSDGPSEQSVTSVTKWISDELITDPVILVTSGLDNQDTIRGFLTISKSNFELITNKVQDETLVADIGVLMYPYGSNETIRIFNIKLYVWIKDVSVGGGAISKYEVGLRGSVFSQIYESNAEGIKNLKPHTIEGAIKEYETFVAEVHEFVKDRS